MSRTIADRWFSDPRLPHEATTLSAPCISECNTRSFPGPIGSTTLVNPRGSLVLNANRLTTLNSRCPHLRVKSMHRRMVGSSSVASATEGFSMMNRQIPDPEGETSLHREYLNVPHSLITAPSFGCLRMEPLEPPDTSDILPATCYRRTRPARLWTTLVRRNFGGAVWRRLN